jgi:hypothetical protein
MAHSIFNTVIWVVIILLPLIIRYFHKKVWRFCITFIPLLLIGIQFIALTSATLESGAMEEDNRAYFLSTDGLYEVSAKDNIIVIILDRLDEDYINGVVEESPQYFDRLDGFTRFTNNVTYYSRTFPAVANMMSGKIHLFDRPAKDYFDEAWGNTFLPELRSHDYTTKLYIDEYYAYSDYTQMIDIADNLEEGMIKANHYDMLGLFSSLTTFRYAPHALKSGFWFSPDLFRYVYWIEGETDLFNSSNFIFHEKLKEQKITVQDQKNSFVFYHLDGTHTPHDMDENGMNVGISTVTAQTKGCFTIVYEYLDQLKELGLYDNSTIIITGDHGFAGDLERLTRPLLTGLFVKPKGSSGTPLKTNNAPVNADNFRATIVEAAGLDASAYGETYFDVDEDADIVRKYYFRINPQYGNPGFLEEFDIHNDARDFENWEKIVERIISYWR